MKSLSVTLFICLFFTASLSASSPVEIQVLEKEIIANINVVDLYRLNLRITFENVIGLNENAVSVSAVQINPNDLTLLNRLGSASITVPPQLPVVVNVSPSAQSSLTFTGAMEIELYTSNLDFQTTPSLRLFKSPNGGNLEDVTNFAGVGSYRVRGTSGDFSDLLIVADARTRSQTCNSKFSQLQDTLTTNSSRIEATMLSNLQAKVNAAYSSYQQGLTAQAVSSLESLITDIKADNGQTIPNLYRANDPNSRNVAGKLREQAATLIFSLQR